MINKVQRGTSQRESGIVPISTARQRSSKAAAPLSAARPINTVAPKLFVNAVKTKPTFFQKAHSLSRRPFNQQTTLNNRSLNNKVNTAKINYVNTAKGKKVTSAVGKQGINAVKSSTCWGDPQVSLKDTGIFDSGSSRHMTGNKSFLTDYQDYDGDFVAFAGSSKGGRITGKVTILNTLDHLGKFDGKADEGFLVGYSINSKAFRVFNSRTRKVEENLHVNFLENKPNGCRNSNVSSKSEKEKSPPKDDGRKGA
ncbi:putative ribonuclease H-like domain-containing protein [Tanacetum coccineum]